MDKGWIIILRTFMGKFVCGLCALCGVFIITLPIPIVVSSFAMCYKVRPGIMTVTCDALIRGNSGETRSPHGRGWRAGVRQMMCAGMLLDSFRVNKRSQKSDILFNLKTSGGLSGVRKKSEVFK